MTSIKSRFCATGMHLLYSLAIKFMWHAARTISQLSRLQFIGFKVLWRDQISSTKLPIPGESPKWVCAKEKGSATTCVPLLGTCGDNPVVEHWVTTICRPGIKSHRIAMGLVFTLWSGGHFLPRATTTMTTTAFPRMGHLWLSPEKLLVEELVFSNAVATNSNVNGGLLRDFSSNLIKS